MIGISTETARRLLCAQTANQSRPRPTLYLILLLALQLIYETVIATLALTYMVPSSSLNCGLDEQWKHLWRTKNEAAIRRIQDRYNCCGFNSVVDRAWPFPGRDGNVGVCKTRYERTRSCAGPWRQAEQVNAGLFLIIAAVIFATKACNLSLLMRKGYIPYYLSVDFGYLWRNFTYARTSQSLGS